eukprot:EG_transcript_16901
MTIRRLLQLHAKGVERQRLSPGCCSADTARPAHRGLAGRPIHSDGVAVPLDHPPFPDDPAQCDDATSRAAQGPPVGPVGHLRSHRGPPPAAGPQLIGGRPRVRRRRVRRPPTGAHLRPALCTLRSVTSTSDHLLQPLRKPSPIDDAPLQSKVLSARAEGALLRRLYNPQLLRSRRQGAVAGPLTLSKSKALSSETKDVLLKRLLQPSPAVGPPLPTLMVLRPKAEEALLERLYRRPLDAEELLYRTERTPRTRRLKAKEQAEFVKKFHKDRMDQVAFEAKSLEQKYLPPPAPSPKLSRSSVEELNERFYYRPTAAAQKSSAAVPSAAGQPLP